MRSPKGSTSPRVQQHLKARAGGLWLCFGVGGLLSVAGTGGQPGAGLGPGRCWGDRRQD